MGERQCLSDPRHASPRWYRFHVARSCGVGNRSPGAQSVAVAQVGDGRMRGRGPFGRVEGIQGIRRPSWESS